MLSVDSVCFYSAMDWDRVSVACLLHSCCIFIHCWATSLPNLPINYPGKPSEWQSPVCHSQYACLLFHTVNNLVSQCPSWGSLRCATQNLQHVCILEVKATKQAWPDEFNCVSETSQSLKEGLARPLLSKPNENQIQLNGNDPGSESKLIQTLGQVNDAWHILAHTSLSG